MASLVFRATEQKEERKLTCLTRISLTSSLFTSDCLSATEEPGTSLKNTDHATEEPGTNLKNTDHTTEEPCTSLKNTDHATKKRGTSLKNTDHATEEPGTSLKITDHDTEKLGTSLKNTHSARKEPGTSVKNIDHTAEEADTSINNTDHAVEQPGTSLKNADVATKSSSAESMRLPKTAEAEGACLPRESIENLNLQETSADRIHQSVNSEQYTSHSTTPAERIKREPGTFEDNTSSLLTISGTMRQLCIFLDEESSKHLAFGLLPSLELINVRLSSDKLSN